MNYQIFHDIALAVQSDVPAIIWRDIDKGQLENPDQFESILPPAVLLSVGEIEWETQSDGSELGTGTVTTKLVLVLTAPTWDSNLFRTSLEELNLADNLHECLMGVKGIHSRIKSHTYPSGTFTVSESTYQASFYPPTLKRFRRVSATVKINERLKNPSNNED